jgi:hypothetical protein
VWHRIQYVFYFYCFCFLFHLWFLKHNIVSHSHQHMFWHHYMNFYDFLRSYTVMTPGGLCDARHCMFARPLIPVKGGVIP